MAFYDQHSAQSFLWTSSGIIDVGEWGPMLQDLLEAAVIKAGAMRSLRLHHARITNELASKLEELSEGQLRGVVIIVVDAAIFNRKGVAPYSKPPSTEALLELAPWWPLPESLAGPPQQQHQEQLVQGQLDTAEQRAQHVQDRQPQGAAHDVPTQQHVEGLGQGLATVGVPVEQDPQQLAAGQEHEQQAQQQGIADQQQQAPQQAARPAPEQATHEAGQQAALSTARQEAQQAAQQAARSAAQQAAQEAGVQAGVPYSNPKGMTEPQLLQVLAAVVSYHSYDDCKAKFVHAVLSTDAQRFFNMDLEAQHKAGTALEMYIKTCKGESAAQWC